MANPPIVIGPFANVPAPGSPIKSDWPQQISTYVSETLPKGVQGLAYGSTADLGIGSALTDIPGMTVTFTAVASRIYLAIATVTVNQSGAAGFVTLALADAANANDRVVLSAIGVNEFATYTIQHAFVGAGGARTVKARLSVNAGTVTYQGQFGRAGDLIVLDTGKLI